MKDHGFSIIYKSTIQEQVNKDRCDINEIRLIKKEETRNRVEIER